MSRKRRRSRRQKPVQTDQQAAGVANSQAFKAAVQASQSRSEAPAKIGPGQVFIRELIDASSGHAKRFRNVGESALSNAFYRGFLRGAYDNESGITAEDRHSAGQRFAKLWAARMAISTTNFELGLSNVGNDPHWWTDRKADASEAIHRLQMRMYPKNFQIVQRFCGEDYSMPQSITGVVEVHRNSVVPRVREALDDLVTAMTGRRVYTDASTAGTARQLNGNGR